MISFIFRMLVSAAVIFGVSYFLPALIKVNDFYTAALAAVFLAIVNALIRPVVAFISIPITFLTLGIFSLFINAGMLYIVSYLLSPSFTIMGLWQGVAAALIISIFSTAFSSATK